MANRVTGAVDLERALGQLPRATGKNVLRRALRKSAKPIVETAQRIEQSTPRRTATEDLTPTIRMAAKLKASQSDGKKYPVEIFLGSTAPDAHWKEFGTQNTPPFPFLRPAWDGGKNKLLQSVSTEIWDALRKSARTLARKAERGTLSKAAVRALRS